MILIWYTECLLPGFIRMQRNMQHTHTYIYTKFNAEDFGDNVRGRFLFLRIIQQLVHTPIYYISIR